MLNSQSPFGRQNNWRFHVVSWFNVASAGPSRFSFLTGALNEDSYCFRFSTLCTHQNEFANCILPFVYGASNYRRYCIPSLDFFFGVNAWKYRVFSNLVSAMRQLPTSCTWLQDERIMPAAVGTPGQGCSSSFPTLNCRLVDKDNKSPFSSDVMISRL